MDRVFRLQKRMKKTKFKLIAKILRYYLRVVYACDISPNVVIGEGTKFAHNGLGVVIHPEVVVGNNCKILHGVTIGGRGEGSSVPIIGNNVLIGAGAIVLGSISIGDNAQIGAGALVIQSVPSNAVVVGNPAKVIKYVKIINPKE